MTIYIHGDERDVKICSIGLRDMVYTIGQFWICIWVRRWGQYSICMRVVSSTQCETFFCTAFNLKSITVVDGIRVKSEINNLSHVALVNEISSGHNTYFIHKWFWPDWIDEGILLPHSLPMSVESSSKPSRISRLSDPNNPHAECLYPNLSISSISMLKKFNKITVPTGCEMV